MSILPMGSDRNKIEELERLVAELGAGSGGGGGEGLGYRVAFPYNWGYSSDMYNDKAAGQSGNSRPDNEIVSSFFRLNSNVEQQRINFYGAAQGILADSPYSQSAAYHAVHFYTHIFMKGGIYDDNFYSLKSAFPTDKSILRVRFHMGDNGSSAFMDCKFVPNEYNDTFDFCASSLVTYVFDNQSFSNPDDSDFMISFTLVNETAEEEVALTSETGARARGISGTMHIADYEVVPYIPT
ncbi:hypothetical protein ST37_01730 (plasmid) [Vibrio sp. qd031]|uniref:hypothetical protein n=1 Tax=Vibrio sp. qd031 TaxID=1603038 RepID=UPI000A10EE7E|nr:hypothetical protein [Vibrio sp. qd031]ORT52516.1 hypothetical protein ST37_01730 [Vibrio sp. qd031]